MNPNKLAEEEIKKWEDNLRINHPNFSFTDSEKHYMRVAYTSGYSRGYGVGYNAGMGGEPNGN